MVMQQGHGYGPCCPRLPTAIVVPERGSGFDLLSNVLLEECTQRFGLAGAFISRLGGPTYAARQCTSNSHFLGLFSLLCVHPLFPDVHYAASHPPHRNPAIQ